ncbi:MAG: nicotinate-nucleotide adenylyltransferase [Pseudohongiella sp.]|nr:nicotinate-nucleotide adenylyltransferase [Pseudohongiella sp.]
MGGMFDPVHQGHLAAARLALNELALDVVHMVPCARPNHRAQPGASGTDRLAMLELAIAGDNRLLADDRELKRPGVSYMVDTLRSFVDEFPQAILVYILGRDSFYSLPGWHQWRQLLDLCHLAVTNRPDVNVQMPAELAQEVDKRLVTDVNSLFSPGNGHGRVLMLDDLDIPVSSSAIRQSLARADMPAQVPQPVQAYIRQHGLYISTVSGPAESGSAGRSHT